MDGTWSRRPRTVTRLLVLAGLLCAVVLATASPAQAHAVLVGTTPAAGYSVAGPVRQITLTFSEPVSASPDAVRVTGPTTALPSPAEAADQGRALVIRTGLLGDGVYRVRWRVTADDGDVVEGTYSFAVGNGVDSGGLSGRGSPGGLTGSLLATAVLRWGLFLGLSIGIGGAAGQFLTGRLRRLSDGLGARPLPPAVLLPVAAGAAVGGLAALGLTVHALGGSSWTAGAGRLLSWRALSGPGVRSPAVEVLLFGLAAVAAGLPVRRLRGLALGPLLAVAVVEGLRGHLHEQDGPGGALLIGVHVALAAAWTGALVTVLRTAASWRAAGRATAAWHLIGLYSRAALVGYLLVTATGTLAAALLLPGPASLAQTGYGRVLCLKLVLVAVVTLLALHSRRRLRSEESSFVGGRAQRLQPRVMIAVLAATALLVSLSPPRLSAQAQQALPPPAPSGPVEQLGTLAGQLTVGLSVSAGQLRVQVTSPSSDDGRQEPFRVTARAGPLHQPLRSTALRPCGPGCFATPVDVAAPGLTVLLDIASPGWHGGQASFDVPWPPRPAGAALTRALRLLRATRQVTFDERVSSDTTRPALIAQTLRDSGAAFLATEPYGAPSSATTFTLQADGGSPRVAFGVAGTFFVEFTLDAAGRIRAERLVTPNHLILRRFRYPR